LFIPLEEGTDLLIISAAVALAPAVKISSGCICPCINLKTHFKTIKLFPVPAAPLRYNQLFKPPCIAGLISVRLYINLTILCIAKRCLNDGGNNSILVPAS